MPRLFTLHRADSSSDPDDYVIRYNGTDVGRCFARTLSNRKRMWGWLIFMARDGICIPPGTTTAGYEPTQDEAKEQFRKNYDRLMGKRVLSKALNESQMKPHQK
jgi:hypothetical protein